MLKRLLRDRKGISLVEVVVAMTVVVMITGAAISIVIASINADVAFRNKDRALAACENAEECLRFSQGDSSVLNGALGAAGFSLNDGVYTDETGDVEITVEVSGKATVKYKDRVVYTYTPKVN